MQQHHCPRHRLAQTNANRSNPHFFTSTHGASARVDMANQLYEKYDKTGGADLGMSEKILRCR
jgi:hypothetical protein